MKKKEERIVSQKKVQDIQVGVLKELIRICDENGYKYYLACGSLIGAVRHNGYIPWDDDIDVFMPRKDFNQLVLYCKENQNNVYKLAHYSIDKKYIYPIARLYDNRYKVIFEREREYELGPFVDIYPLDGCGDSIEESIKIKQKMAHLRSKISLLGYKKYFKKTSSIKAELYWRLFYIVGSIVGVNHYIKKIDDLAQKISYEFV